MLTAASPSEQYPQSKVSRARQIRHSDVGAVSSSCSSSSSLVRLRSNDIVSRIGRPQHNAQDDHKPSNVGNACFDAIILKHSHAYQQTTSRELKKDIVNNVLREVARRNPGGRFVKNLANKNRYALLRHESIVAKVTRALKEAASALSSVGTCSSSPLQQPRQGGRRLPSSSNTLDETNAAKATAGRRGKKNKTKQQQNHNVQTMMLMPLPAITLQPKSLETIAQELLQLILTMNDNKIDIDKAANVLNVPKPNMHQVVDILDGAGVLERIMSKDNKDDNDNHDTDAENESRHHGRIHEYCQWTAPIIRTPDGYMKEMETLGREENVLDYWIECVANHFNTPRPLYIGMDQLSTLLHKDTALLAVHLPPNAVVRTVHLPADPRLHKDSNTRGEYAFQLSVRPCSDSSLRDSIVVPTHLLRHENATSTTSTKKRTYSSMSSSSSSPSLASTTALMWNDDDAMMIGKENVSNAQMSSSTKRHSSWNKNRTSNKGKHRAVRGDDTALVSNYQDCSSSSSLATKKARPFAKPTTRSTQSKAKRAITVSNAAASYAAMPRGRRGRRRRQYHHPC